MNREFGPVDTREGYKKRIHYTLASYLGPFYEQTPFPRNVLSLGCGPFADEVPAVLSLFPKAHYVGMDINVDYISSAQGLHGGLERTSFIVGDNALPPFGKDIVWDCIIIRHPQVFSVLNTNVQKSWEKSIKSCIEALNDNGVLFITADDDRERKIIEGYLRAYPQIDIVINEINPLTNKARKTFDDRYVFVAKKSS